MCRSKASKIILMMSKIFKKIHLNKIKKIMKIQEKTQDMQEPKEKHQDKFKENFSNKILNNTKLSKRIFQELSFTRVFTLW